MSNVRQLAAEFENLVVSAWREVFGYTIANTIVCERCTRPYTYWTKEPVKPGQLRHFCDTCANYE